MQAPQLLRDELNDKLRQIIERQRSDRPVKIAPERALAETLGVSRLSLRAAIGDLVDEGLLVRKQGSGTFIVPNVKLDSLDLYLAPGIKPKDPFYQDFVSTFSRSLGRRSISVRLIDGHAADGRAGDARAADGRAAGVVRSDNPLVIVGLAPQEEILRLKECYRHIVSVQSYPDTLDIGQIFFDDYMIGRHAGQILREYGHRKVVHIAGPQKYPSAAERLRGFSDAADGELSARIIHGKMNWSSGYALGDEVFDLVRGDFGASAVFTVNDWLALGLIRRLAERGVTVPDELSVIGCDDIHLATEIEPKLATFKWDIEFLVGELLHMLESTMSNESYPHKRVMLPAQFVKRDSLKEVG